MDRINQTSAENEQAIKFHLEMDKKLGRIDKSSWPEWLVEIYNKKQIQEKGNLYENTSEYE